MEALIRTHLANFGDPKVEEIYAEDIVVTFPYAPSHHTGKLDGKEKVLGFLTAIGKYFADIRLSEPTFHQTQDPSVMVVEVDGESISKETGRTYKQHYVSFVTVKDGKIVGIREFYDPLQVLISTGELEPFS